MKMSWDITWVELLALYWDTQTQANAISQAVERARSEHRRRSSRPRPVQVQQRLGPAAVAELVTAYRAGAGVKALARQFGVHRETASAILRREGVAVRRRGLTSEQVAAATDLYQQGWSLAQLGEKFSVDPTTVWRALVAAGVSMRSPYERVR